MRSVWTSTTFPNTANICTEGKPMEAERVYAVDQINHVVYDLGDTTKKEAQKLGNGLTFIETKEDIVSSRLTDQMLADLWNNHNEPEHSVVRWGSREVAANKLFGIFPQIAKEKATMSVSEDTAPAAKKKGAKKAPAKKAPAKKAAAKKGAPGKGNAANLVKRASRFAGMKLTPSAAAKKDNPRKAGSHGWKSMEIIRKKPGISYEDFINAGGRNNDLGWDVDKGNVVAK